MVTSKILRIAGLLSLTSLCALNTACSAKSDSAPSPAVIVAPQPVLPITQGQHPVISNVMNRGIQSGGQFKVEINGQFAYSGNGVQIVCGTARPGLTKVSESANQIVLLMDQVNDSCSFVVQNGSGSSATSEAVVFSNHQMALNIGQASSGGVSSNLQTVVLTGSFYGANDAVWAMCDGGQYAQVSAVDVLMDSATEIRFTIATPVNFNGCQFYVEANGVQSPNYAMLEISSWSYGGVDPAYSGYGDFTLSGAFVGAGDEVWVRCDSGSFYQVSDSYIMTDSGTEISFRMETQQSYSTCEAYVVSQGVQSSIYYFN